MASVACSDAVCALHILSTHACIAGRSVWGFANSWLKSNRAAQCFLQQSASVWCNSFSSEAIYVNVASVALAGAALGFLPYNFSKKMKIFMGDSGSLLCGFTLALVAMGTKYSSVNPLGVYAPLFILAIPIYDTLFVSVMRLRRGHSPFIGSKDHFALRLEKIGFSRHWVVFLAATAALLFSVFAFLITQVPLIWGALIYLVIGGAFLLISIAIAKIKI